MIWTRVLIAVLLITGLASVAYADARSAAKEQVEFGISLAQRGLWKEAMHRWRRALEIDPTYAEAYNDVAVAQEHEGKLAEAREAYDKALKLAPDHAMIRQNYELFKEINDRTDRRQNP
jgi:Tfp pilus assembly protein PilF